MSQAFFRSSEVVKCIGEGSALIEIRISESIEEEQIYEEGRSDHQAVQIG